MHAVELGLESIKTKRPVIWDEVTSRGGQIQCLELISKLIEILFSWAPKSLQMVTAAMEVKDACSLEEKLW